MKTLRNLFYRYFVLPIWNPIKDLIGIESDSEIINKIKGLFGIHSKPDIQSGSIVINSPLTDEEMEDFKNKFDKAISEIRKEKKI